MLTDRERMLIEALDQFVANEEDAEDNGESTPHLNAARDADRLEKLQKGCGCHYLSTCPKHGVPKVES